MGLFATLFRPKRKALRLPAAPKRPAAAPPLPAAPAPVREYVAQTVARLGWSRGGGYWFGGRDSTNETWEMRRDYSEMTADESVDSATEAVLSDISSQTIQVLPNPADDPTRGQAVKDFVHHATTQLGSGDLSSLQTGGVPGLVDAIARHAFVHKRSACQIVLNDHRETQGRWAGKQFVRCVKPKAPETYDLDLDEMLNVRGIVNRGPDAKALPLLPLAGWILYVNRAMYGRPEGRSLYRAAHRYWLAKHRAFQLWGECSDKLTGGLLIGKGASPQNSERFFQILCEARGSGVIVLEEPGWEVVLENLEQGAGAVIERFIRYCDEAIFRAIRGAHLQQLEGQVKDGRGDTKVAESQSDKPTWQHLYRISETITRYFNTYLVRHNFAQGTPVPVTVLGDIDPGDTMSRLRIAAVMRNELGMELSNEQLYRTSPFGPPSKEPGDVNRAPAPPAAVRPQTQEAIPGGPLGAYSESAGPLHTFCGGPGSGRPGPCPEPTADHSRHRPDLPRHAATGRELPTAPPAVSLDDAVATIEKHFGKGAIQIVDQNAVAAPKLARSVPAPVPKPRHVQLAEREAAARKQLADLEGSHDQEASFDRAAARHELELIDAERRGLPAPKFGPHRYGETAHRPPGTPEGGQFTSGPGGGGESGAPDAAKKSAGGKKKFEKSRAKVKVSDTADPETVESLREQLIGYQQLDDIPSLVGAPDDAEVTVTVSKSGKALWVEVRHDAFTAERYIKADDNGFVVMHNEEFWMKPEFQKGGLGSEVFARQVQFCQDAGLDYVECHAAKENPRNPAKPHNGYYTWPRLGYDMSLTSADGIHDADAHVYAAARAQFPGAQTVLDVMASKDGRDWWKANGADMLEARFDLSPGSRSMRVMEAYLEERKQHAAAYSEAAGGAPADSRGVEGAFLSDGEEAALDRAWAKLTAGGRALPPPSSFDRPAPKKAPRSQEHKFSERDLPAELPATLRDLADALRNQPAPQVTVTPEVTVHLPEPPEFEIVHERGADGNLRSRRVPVPKREGGESDTPVTPGG